MTRYAIALALTLAIEVPLYTAVLWRMGAVPVQRSVFVGIVVNLVSHPLAFVVVHPLLRRATGDAASLAIVEVAVMLGEAWGAWGLTRQAPAALVAAAAANTVSLTIGVLLL